LVRSAADLTTAMIARRLQIAQAKGHRVRIGGGSGLVDKGFTGVNSKQVGQFLKGNAGLAQDRSQRAAFEISTMIRHSDQQPRLLRMP
jgi:hypothetical protein